MTALTIYERMDLYDHEDSEPQYESLEEEYDDKLSGSEHYCLC